MIWRPSPLSRSIVGYGTPAGATTPKNAALTRSGMPSSTTVGTSGHTGERSVEDTIRPFIRPPCRAGRQHNVADHRYVARQHVANGVGGAPVGHDLHVEPVARLEQAPSGDEAGCRCLEVAKRTFCDCLFIQSTNSGPVPADLDARWHSRPDRPRLCAHCRSADDGPTGGRRQRAASLEHCSPRRYSAGLLA